MTRVKPASDFSRIRHIDFSYINEGRRAFAQPMSSTRFPAFPSSFSFSRSALPPSPRVDLSSACLRSEYVTCYQQSNGSASIDTSGRRRGFTFLSFPLSIRRRLATVFHYGALAAVLVRQLSHILYTVLTTCTINIGNEQTMWQPIVSSLAYIFIKCYYLSILSLTCFSSSMSPTKQSESLPSWRFSYERFCRHRRTCEFKPMYKFILPLL